MNSSGIKRGLAATAVAALAVTGLPFLASSASAETGDEIVVGSVGPTLNGGTAGGVVVLKTKGITQADAERLGSAAGAAFKLANPALNDDPNTPNQTVALVDPPVFTANASDSNPNDGYDEVTLHVAVTTPAAGDTATYAIYLDDNDDDAVNAAEARVQVSQQTSGVVASLAIAPANQTAPLGVASGPYTVTYKDAAGRTTQPTVVTALAATEGNTTFSPASITVAAAELGSAKFAATGTVATGVRHITATAGAVVGNATLDVTTVASAIAAGEVDIVTGADTWDGFGGGAFGGAATQVRPDQTTVKVDVKSPGNAGKTLSLTASSANVTFGGQSSSTQTVTLNGQGVGSVTFTADASSVAAGRTIALSGGGITENLTYTAPAFADATITPDATTYLSSYGGSVTATVTVTDQYGTPAAGTYMTVQRTLGANADASESARKQVGADGKVSFTLTDTKATAASHGTDTLTFSLYAGQFDAVALATDSTSKIVYSANGQGADFTFQVDGVTPTGAAYDPKSVYAYALTDTTADDAGDVAADLVDPDESIAVTTPIGGTNGAPVTVSVDNGALILKNGETRLSQGSATDSGVFNTDTFKIVGTKAGIVNVTVTSGGVTKTGQVSVRTLSESTDPTVVASAANTARNIAVSGPEKAAAGDVVNFTVTVTDAFGNPVAGVAQTSINTLVTGGAQVVGRSAQSDAKGEIVYQVQIGDSTDSPVTLQVVGTGADFGAAANRLSAASTTDDGTGLTASKSTASATIAEVANIEALEQAVADAQAAVDSAQDAVDAAKGDLAVAKAERNVAQKNVKHAKQALRKAKKRHHGVAAARRELRAARGEMRVANAKVRAELGKVNRANDRLAAAQAELEAAQQALEDAQK